MSDSGFEEHDVGVSDIIANKEQSTDKTGSFSHT